MKFSTIAKRNLRKLLGWVIIAFSIGTPWTLIAVTWSMWHAFMALIAVIAMIAGVLYGLHLAFEKF